MDRSADIYQQIMADPQNAAFTQRGIAPLYHVEPEARILIISQAPSRKGQESMTYWDDPSGDRLRAWMGMSREEFYHSGKLGVVPLDFYFPGKGRQGDLPPRKGFAEKWHKPVLELMPKVSLTLLIGAYAQKYYLQKRRQKTLTETVAHYQDYLPEYFPIVHPSPLNYGWMHQHPWFEKTVVPELQADIRRLLAE